MGRKTPVHWHEHINNSDALTSKTRREGAHQFSHATAAT
eukprot:SAG25_NODE_14245_length_257_cov_0.658228_1_plen_38_part_10